MLHLLTKVPFGRRLILESEIILHGILSIVNFLSIVTMDILSKSLDQAVAAVYCALIPLRLIFIMDPDLTVRGLSRPITDDFLNRTEAPFLTA